jgi:hypothetical protein
VCSVLLKSTITGIKKYKTAYEYLFTKESTEKGLTNFDMKILSHMLVQRYQTYDYDLESFKLKNIRQVDSTTDFEKIKNKRLEMSYRILNELNQINIDIDYENSISVYDLYSWIVKYYPNRISMFAMDPFLQVFKSHVATIHNNNRITLMFVVNNAHVYPIYEANLQNQISKAKEWKLETVNFNVQGFNYKKIEKFHVTNNNPLDFGVECNNDNRKYNKLVSGKLDNSKIYVLEENIENVLIDIINETGYIDIAVHIRDSEIHNLSHFAESCKISKKLQQIQQFVYFT